VGKLTGKTDIPNATSDHVTVDVCVAFAVNDENNIIFFPPTFMVSNGLGVGHSGV